MKTRMWIVELDRYGAADRKTCIDEPAHIPRVDEFVESESAAGTVQSVQWLYPSDTHQDSSSYLIVNVYLRKSD